MEGIYTLKVFRGASCLAVASKFNKYFKQMENKFL